MTIFHRNGIAGPKPHFLFGNWRILWFKGHRATFRAWIRQYGKVVGFYLGGRPHLLVADPNLLNIILCIESDKFARKDPIDGNFSSSFAESASVFNKCPNDVKGVRDFLSGYFVNSKNTQRLIERANKVVQEFIKELTKSSGQETEISSLVQQLSASLAVQFFCHDPETTPEAQEVLASAISESSKRRRNWLPLHIVFPEFSFFLKPLVYIFAALQNTFGSSSESLLVSYIRRLYRTTLWCESYSEKSKDCDFLRILAHKSKPSDNAELDANSNGVENSPRKPLDECDAVANCITLLKSTIDVSTVLTASLHSMANMPNFQEAARREVLKNCKSGLNIEELDKLELLESLILETLRLYSTSGLAVTRVASEDYVYKTKRIPKGTTIIAATGHLHSNCRFFENAEQFDPYRFAGDDRQRECVYWQPFGIGARECVGKRLAMLQLKLCLAMLLKQFRFETTVGTQQGMLSTSESLTHIYLSEEVLLRISLLRVDA